eukprot:scaffold168522_cov18-Tisochrysis_lutea.AAC.2
MPGRPPVVDTASALMTPPVAPLLPSGEEEAPRPACCSSFCASSALGEEATSDSGMLVGMASRTD